MLALRGCDETGEAEELRRVLRLAVDQHLVMDMRTGRSAGAAEETDLGMPRHALPDRYGLAVKMGVAARDAVTVVDLDDLAVIVAIPGIGHGPCRRRVDRRHVGRLQIDPGMVGGMAVDRVAAHPERAAELIAFERRRNRQRLDQRSELLWARIAGGLRRVR